MGKLITKKALNRVYSQFRWIEERIRFGNYKEDHIFDISVGDLKFKMSFGDYPIKDFIVERILGIREPETTAIIKSIVQAGDNILELGGCYGYFTLIMAACMGKTGKLVSVEGTPNNFKILQGNIKLNGLQDRVTCKQVFLGKPGMYVYFDPDDRDPYAAIKKMDNGSKNEAYFRTPCVDLCGFLHDLDFVPDKIFMDIEGFEVSAIESLTKSLLKLQKPTIVFAIHEAFYTQGKGLNYLKGLLSGCGYGFRMVDDNLICSPMFE